MNLVSVPLAIDRRKYLTYVSMIEWLVSLIHQIVYYFMFAARGKVASTEFAFRAFEMKIVLNSVKQCALNDDRRKRCPSRRLTIFLSFRGVCFSLAVFICNVNSIRKDLTSATSQFSSFQDTRRVARTTGYIQTAWTLFGFNSPAVQATQTHWKWFRVYRWNMTGYSFHQRVPLCHRFSRIV